jgi:hypothetical protein
MAVILTLAVVLSTDVFRMQDIIIYPRRSRMFSGFGSFGTKFRLTYGNIESSHALVCAVTVERWIGVAMIKPFGKTVSGIIPCSL